MKLHFSRTNGPVDEAIDRLIEGVDGIGNPEYVREMILSALKAGQEAGDDTGGLKLMNTTLKEMRFTAKVFSPYRTRKKVTVFGSARVPPGEPIYEMAKQFGRRLAENGYMVITGGGAGIMHAAHEGAGSEHSFGVNIRLPFEQRPNPVIEGNPRLITYKYFFNRKVAFLKEADAVALFPGGFGTLDEAMETLTLVQTGKRNPLPLVLIDAPQGSYWSDLILFVKEELLSRKYIGGTDFSLFEQVSSVDAAVEKITKFYRRYHSLRYVNGKLVIRLSRALPEGTVGLLKEEFRDMLLPGGDIVHSGPLPVEREDNDFPELPRLVLDFDRRDFGRLKSFIDSLNELP